MLRGTFHLGEVRKLVIDLGVIFVVHGLALIAEHELAVVTLRSAGIIQVCNSQERFSSAVGPIIIDEMAVVVVETGNKRYMVRI